MWMQIHEDLGWILEQYCLVKVEAPEKGLVVSWGETPFRRKQMSSQGHLQCGQTQPFKNGSSCLPTLGNHFKFLIFKKIYAVIYLNLVCRFSITAGIRSPLIKWNQETMNVGSEAINKAGQIFYTCMKQVWASGLVGFLHSDIFLA